MSQGVPAGVDFLCDTATVLRDKMKLTPCICLGNDSSHGRWTYLLIKTLRLEHLD
jgi:hypothetical protein